MLRSHSTIRPLLRRLAIRPQCNLLHRQLSSNPPPAKPIFAEPPSDKALLPPYNPANLRETVVEALQQYDRNYTTTNGWHILRFIGFAGASAIATVLYFRDELIGWLSGQGSELARQTIKDQQLQRDVDQVTKTTTNTLLNDPQTVEVTVDFLLRLLQKEETRAQVVRFLSTVIADPTTVRALSDLLRDPTTVRQLQDTFNVLLRDPVIQKSLNEMIHNLLADPATTKQMEQLIVQLFEQERVKSVVADFFGDVLRYPQVVEAATDSSRIVVEDLSKDEEVHRNLASAGSSSVRRMIISPFVFNWKERTPPEDEDTTLAVLEDEVAEDTEEAVNRRHSL